MFSTLMFDEERIPVLLGTIQLLLTELKHSSLLSQTLLVGWVGRVVLSSVRLRVVPATRRLGEAS